jgi:hypothetical protein
MVPSPFGHGTAPVELAVRWDGGFAQFGEQKIANEMAEKSFFGPTMDGAGMPQGPAKKGDSAAIEAGRKTIGGMGVSTQEGSLRLKTDTMLVGPWDEAAVMTGVTFAAVKKDVYMQMDLRLLGEAKARALVSKAMSRI